MLKLHHAWPTTTRGVAPTTLGSPNQGSYMRRTLSGEGTLNPKSRRVVVMEEPVITCYTCPLWYFNVSSLTATQTTTQLTMPAAPAQLWVLGEEPLLKSLLQLCLTPKSTHNNLYVWCLYCFWGPHSAYF